LFEISVSAFGEWRPTEIEHALCEHRIARTNVDSVLATLQDFADSGSKQCLSLLFSESRTERLSLDGEPPRECLGGLGDRASSVPVAFGLKSDQSQLG
jgi:hypothetical protein